MDSSNFSVLSARIQTALEKQLFFIVGSTKSGTTWLQKMLDAHPEIVCSGEGHFMDKLASPLTSLVKDYGSFMQVVEREVYEGKPCYQPFTIAEFDYIFSCMMALIMSKREISPEIKFLGDKTPVHALYMKDIHRIFPSLKFIHLVRDGRDVVVSNFRHLDRVANPESKKRYGDWSLRGAMADLTKRWLSHVKPAHEFGKEHPEIYHTVRYEDLKSAPEKTFTSLLGFLGAKKTLEIVENCVEASSFKKLSGGREPGQEDPNAFVRKGIVGDWKNVLDEECISIFNAYGEELLRELGYN